MFAQLKSIVDLIRSGISDYQKFSNNNDREKEVLGVLKVYFLIKDCIEEGESLINDAGPDPIAKITEMEASLALTTMKQWDSVIRRQGMRLYTLQQYILGQHHLSVINPVLLDKIREVIGYKLDRAVTLHGIGAALFFKNTFPLEESHEEKAKYIALMAGEEADTLNMPRINTEIANLRGALEQYRIVVERLVTSAELLHLSQRARQETQLVPGA
jgi:hypothetical protein